MFPTLLANSIAADAGLIPGLAIFGPAMGLPLSVLAAFIERPFVTLAVSAAACIALMLYSRWLEERIPRSGFAFRALREYGDTLQWTVAAASLLLLVGAFAATRDSRKGQTVA